MEDMKLSNNPNWNGGRTISSHGYVRLKMPNHHLADIAGYVYEHRLVAEQMLGRPIKPNELVHHKGTKYPRGSTEDKQDNRPDNLLVTNGIAGHKFEHRKSNDLRIPGQPNPMIICGCGCGQYFNKFDDSNRPRRYISGHSWRKGKLCYDPTETIKCACGCGKSIAKYDRYGRQRNFISGHNAVRLSFNRNETIQCACGCGQTRLRYDVHGVERQFIVGHTLKNHMFHYHAKC